MSHAIPDGSFEVTDLFTPNKKPPVKVEIDFSDADTRGMVFFSMPDTHSFELVNTLKGTHSGCKNEGSATGLHLLQDTITDYQYYENRIHSEITDPFTVIFGGSIDSMDTYGTLVGAPYRDDATWTSPWLSFHFSRDVATTSGRVGFSVGSALHNIASDSGFLSIDGSYHQYAVTRNAGAVEFHKDGSQYGAGKTISTGTINWNDNAPVHIGSRNHLTIGEGITGTTKHVAIFNRVLSDEEIKRWHRNSTRFLMPV